MQKILLKRSPITLAVISLYSIIFFLIFFSLFIRVSYTKSAPPVSNEILQNPIDDRIVEVPTEKVKPGLPVRLKIPKIDVDVAIEYAGLAFDGSVDTPKNQENVVWFNLSQHPGESGTAVIAGHYGGKKSAFDNLYKLRKGDKLYIEDDNGITVSFVVRENRRYNPEADASHVFSSNDGKAHLNLITCEGDWDEVSESYSTRLVVFTDKE